MEMNTEREKLIQDLLVVKETNRRFLDRHRETLLGLLEKEEVSADEALLQEILLELSDKIERVSQLIEYLGSKIEREGTLSRDPNGDILLDGIKIPPMQEFEIYLYQGETGMNVWTRTFICPATEGRLPCLAGVEQGRDIEGIRARLRSSDGSVRC